MEKFGQLRLSNSFLKEVTMTYQEARKVCCGKEVVVKETGEHLNVLNAYKPHPDHEIIIFECDDGNIYHNSEVR